jgi:hypothetical protein
MQFPTLLVGLVATTALALAQGVETIVDTTTLTIVSCAESVTDCPGRVTTRLVFLRKVLLTRSLHVSIVAS